MKIMDQATVEFVVQEKDTAKAIALTKEDEFPPVFATSKMIALMEMAAANLMKPQLQSGQLSVGVGVDIKHLAPTPIGETVLSTATFLGMKGKLFHFKVEVFDPAGLVGAGEHTRAIIDTERLMQGAEKRKSKN